MAAPREKLFEGLNGSPFGSVAGAPLHEEIDQRFVPGMPCKSESRAPVVGPRVRVGAPLDQERDGILVSVEGRRLEVETDRLLQGKAEWPSCQGWDSGSVNKGAENGAGRALRSVGSSRR
jgi:hypothetical protein